MEEIQYVNSISVEDYNNLRKSAGWQEVEPSQVKIGLENTAYQIAAVLNGQTIGMARVISDGGYIAFIADVIVHPEHQRKGIGRVMLQQILSHLKSNLKPGERIGVHLMAAKGKEVFYRELGFGERPNEEQGAGMTMMLSE